MISAYWEEDVAEKDREKTAFTTKYGLFEWNVLPFGLCNSPATFQRLMELVMNGLTWEAIIVYLDDILIFGKTFAEMLSRLDTVLTRLESYNLKLKISKCEFGMRHVKFLGHIITENGIMPNEVNIEKI